MLNDVFISQWSWDDESHTSGRMTVVIHYRNGDRTQKTTNFTVGESVDIYGHYFTVYLDYFGYPKLK